MKKPWTNAVFYLIAGVFLAVGPHTLFRVCDTSEKIMKCWWATVAVNVLGGLIAIGGVITLLTGAVSAVNLYSTAAGVAAILIPSVLIGGCSKETMACRALTFPAVYFISAAVILFGIGSLIYSRHKKRGKRDAE